jgi:hypothetical protein
MSATWYASPRPHTILYLQYIVSKIHTALSDVKDLVKARGN